MRSGLETLASNPNSGQPFQNCGSCGKVWETWQDFILDSAVRLLGFQADSRLPDANLLVFEHKCGSSVSVLAKRLRHLLPETDKGMAPPVLFGSEMCGRHCRLIEDLEACDRPCANARDRRLILLFLDMKRGNTESHGPSDP
jgi:hypothetical protein